MPDDRQHLAFFLRSCWKLGIKKEHQGDQPDALFTRQPILGDGYLSRGDRILGRYEQNK